MVTGPNVKHNGEGTVRRGACYWRASEASETLSGVYKFELVQYIYMDMCVP